MLSWIFQKQEAGLLLLDIGRLEEEGMSYVGLGLFFAAFAGYSTWLSFWKTSRGFLQYASLGTEIYELTFLWSMAIIWISLGLSRIEFRDNGICILFRFISWQRIKSYNWEPSKPNILTILYKPNFLLPPIFPLFPTWTSLIIPPRYREAVNCILDERLQDKRLLL
ncbi:DUF5673 domain-containing protein [Altericista sp. CCNU0014]|uniref:DUF5673 domain-containing protein n=1 Tax=Altericista sp. CCNU0014 TaxID=3082949 RepID=UPI00384E225A